MPPLRRAAQYVRMSTESQRYSLEYQALANEAYALEHGYQIVRTFADSGLSGLTLAKRDGLKALLSGVLAGTADFEAILVRDVSRWGRFQDPDQAAHYEFLCREAGIEVQYTAEPFDNDGSLASGLIKHLKRAMAAEYSRDLSDKVIKAKHELGLQGYWPGGNPGLGLRRCPVGLTGALLAPLGLGERNALKGNRVVVVAGPAEEVALVRRVFRRFVALGKTPNALARRLNAELDFAPDGQPWTQARVRRILSNELYVGTRIVGRAQVVLGRMKRKAEPDWLRVRGATWPIVAPSLFNAARRLIKRRPIRTDAEMLADLRRLLAEQGRLSHAVISRDPASASPGLYHRRFGGLQGAYDRIGYVPSAAQRRLTAQIARVRRPKRDSASPLSDEEVLRRLDALRQSAGRLSLELIEVTPGLPRVRNLLKRFGSVARIYDLVGHAASPVQATSMRRRRRQAHP